MGAPDLIALGKQALADPATPPEARVKIEAKLAKLTGASLDGGTHAAPPISAARPTQDIGAPAPSSAPAQSAHSAQSAGPALSGPKKAFRGENAKADADRKKLEGQAPAEPPDAATSIGKGLAHGATLGLGNDLSAMMMGMMPSPNTTGIPEHFAGGSETADLRKTLKTEDRQAQQANPKLYGAADFIGSTAPIGLMSMAPEFAAARGIPGAAKVATALKGASATQGGQAAIGAGTTALVNGAEGFGQSDAPTTSGRVSDAARAALDPQSLMMGAALPMALRPAAQAVEKPLARMANERRASAVMTPEEMIQMKLDKGRDAPAKFGSAIEDLGAHSGGKGNPLPQTPRAYVDNAERMRDEAIKSFKEIDNAAANGPNGPIYVNGSAIAKDFIDEAQKLRALSSPKAHEIAKNLEVRAHNLNPQLTYAQALEERKFIDSEVFTEKGQKNSVVADRLRGIAGKMQQKILDSAQAADPVLKAKIAGANQKYSTAQDIIHYGMGAETRPTLPNTMLGAGAGYGIARYLLPEMGIHADPVLSLMAGGAAIHELRARGPSAAAGALRGAHDLSQGVPFVGPPSIARSAKKKKDDEANP